MKNRDHEKCISCGLIDSSVEAGGIWYCPNPFCLGPGATNWKRENLKIIEKNLKKIERSNGLELKNYDGWLEKGMKEIDKMSYEKGNKIMSLSHTKKIIKILEDFELEKTCK